MRQEAPTLPSYNIRGRDVQKVANYLKTLDNRLSQPKLKSPIRQASNTSLSPSPSRNNANTAALRASPSIVKPNRQGGLLMATTGSNASLHRMSQSPQGLTNGAILKNMSMAAFDTKHEKHLANQGSQIFKADPTT